MSKTRRLGQLVSTLGSLEVQATSAAGSTIRLYEDTDNGANFVQIKASDNLASNVTFTMPSVDGTNGQALVTNGSGTLSFASAGVTTGKAIAMAIVFG